MRSCAPKRGLCTFTDLLRFCIRLVACSALRLCPPPSAPLCPPWLSLSRRYLSAPGTEASCLPLGVAGQRWQGDGPQVATSVQQPVLSKRLLYTGPG